MQLWGKDISGKALLGRIEERLQLRGLSSWRGAGDDALGFDEPVHPLTFHLSALETHADPTQPLPLSPPAGWLGRARAQGRRLLVHVGRGLVDEVFSRQRLFNGHVRDAYAQLSSEVLQLKEELERLKAERAKAPARAASPSKKRKTTRRSR